MLLERVAAQWAGLAVDNSIECGHPQAKLRSGAGTDMTLKNYGGPTQVVIDVNAGRKET